MKKKKCIMLRKICLPILAELHEAPRKTERNGLHWEITIGIGNDHVAYFTIDDEALKALQSGEPVYINCLFLQ